jgi:hypothetical protein
MLFDSYIVLAVFIVEAPTSSSPSSSSSSSVFYMGGCEVKADPNT